MVGSLSTPFGSFFEIITLSTIGFVPQKSVAGFLLVRQGIEITQGTSSATKKWTMHMGENDATVRTDTLRQCIGRATGVSPGSLTLRERWHYY
jgi:hypothetical protein